MTSAAAPHRPRRPGRRFDVGDRVVHPHHGAGEVVARGRRQIHGSVDEYLEIELTTASLRIIVPVASAARIGLRPVVGPRKMQRIVDVLQSEPQLVDTNWSHRQKHHRARLKGGDVLELAAVVRDLAGQAAASQLSANERELYERARRLLASELQYALGVDAEHAAAYIDEHVSGNAPRSRRPSVPEIRLRDPSAPSVGSR